MSVSALVCLAPGSEETEAVTTIDILVRAGINVTTASVAGDGALEIICSRGVRLLADTRLVDVADQKFDVIVLPGGIKGAECFRDSPLLVATVRQPIMRAVWLPQFVRLPHWCSSITSYFP